MQQGTKVRILYPKSWRGWWAIADTNGKYGVVVDMRHKVTPCGPYADNYRYVLINGRRFAEQFHVDHLRAI